MVPPMNNFFLSGDVSVANYARSIRAVPLAPSMHKFWLSLYLESTMRLEKTYLLGRLDLGHPLTLLRVFLYEMHMRLGKTRHQSL
jgi:hypothetical protein